MPTQCGMKIFALFGRPSFLRAFHGWCTVFWLPVTGLAFWTGWLKSVTFVSLMSMVALFLGSFSAWQAARVEVKQEEQAEASEERAPEAPDCRWPSARHRIKHGKYQHWIFDGGSGYCWLPCESTGVRLAE
jgi:hypothetical protein